MAAENATFLFKICTPGMKWHQPPIYYCIPALMVPALYLTDARVNLPIRYLLAHCQGVCHTLTELQSIQHCPRTWKLQW